MGVYHKLNYSKWQKKQKKRGRKKHLPSHCMGNTDCSPPAGTGASEMGGLRPLHLLDGESLRARSDSCSERHMAGMTQGHVRPCHAVWCSAAETKSCSKAGDRLAVLDLGDMASSLVSSQGLTSESGCTGPL